MGAPRKPWLLLIAVALVPSIDAVARLGRLHPDEVFQSLEPALRQAFGYGTQAWEWRVGLRNWFIPDVFSLFLRLGHLVGLDDPWARRALLELPQFALNLAMLAAAHRFAARRIGATTAKWAIVLLLGWGPWVWFAGRTMSESISTALLVCALERLDDDTVDAWGALGAGTLLGFAEVTRYGSAAVILPVLIFLAARGRFVALRATILGGGIVALELGLLDRLTWGHWFHSLREYVHFNLLTGGASSFGRLPPHWYLTHAWVGPLGILAVGLWAWRRDRSLRSWLFASASLTYLLAISVTEHKELRFLYPALTLMLVAVAPAFVRFAMTHRLIAAGALASSLLLYLVKTPYDVERSDLFRATIAAGRTGSGLLLINEGPWGSGGSFYLGKDLPWVACPEPESPCVDDSIHRPGMDRTLYVVDVDDPARENRIRTALQGAGFEERQRVGDIAVFERASGFETTIKPFKQR